MPDPRERLPLHVLRRIDAICDRFEAATQAKSQPRVEDYLEEFRGGHLHVLLVQLLRIELEARARKETLEVIRADFQVRFPSHPAAIEEVFKSHQAAHQSANHVSPQSARSPVENAIRIHCPHCNNAVELAVDSPFVDIECTTCGSHFSVVDGDSGTRDAAQIARIGRFELIERLGLGGFGTVWKARDKRLDRTVAVKIPRKGQLRHEEQEKFLREARAAAQLHHPNIVAVHEVGRDGDADTVYIVSEIVRGVSLSDWITAKKLTTKRATGLCATIADALAHAHDRGVVHRDLKPQNIILDNDQAPHLTDFGLAKREGGEITMTVDGQVLGTPAYMPPEQATGDAHSADGRSDIYSLGVILFQLLTGELPFRGNARMLIHQVVHDDAPSPRKLNASIPRDLETICLKCLEKEPGSRYQTARELANDLNSFLRNEPISARPISPLAKGWRWCQRNAVVASLIAAVLASLLAGLIVSSVYAAKLAAQNQRNKLLAASALIDKTDLLLQVRPEAYKDLAYENISKALALGGSDIDVNRLRRTAAAAMGDFVALAPIDHQFAAEVIVVALHPSKSLMAVGLINGQVQFVDPLTQEVLFTWDDENNDPVSAIRFDAVGTQLACVRSSFSASGKVDATGSVIFLDSQPDGSWSWKRQVTLDESFDSASLTPSLKHVTVRTVNSVSIWNIEEKNRVYSIQSKALLEGFDVPNDESDSEEEVYLDIQSCVFSEAKRLLAIGYRINSGNEHGLILYDQQEGKLTKLPMEKGSTYRESIAFSSDGSLFVMGADRAIATFDVSSSFKQLSSRITTTIKAVAISNDQQFFATVGMRGGVTLWVTSTANESARLTLPTEGTSDESVVFSNDSKFLAASNRLGVRVWHLAGAVERQVLPVHEDSVSSVDFSQDGKHLLIGSKDQSLSIINATTGQRVDQIEIGSAVQTARYSPSGKRVAVGVWGNDLSVQFWDVDARKLVARGTHSLGEVNRLTFIDDEHVAAACDLGVAIWKWPMSVAGADVEEVRYLEPVKVEQRFPAETIPKPVCFAIVASSDGNELAYVEHSLLNGIRTERVRMWRWKTDALSRWLSQDSPAVLQGWHSIAFLPNSTAIVYSGKTGQTHVWSEAGKVSDIGADGSVGGPFLALSPNGRWLATLRDGATVSIRDMTSRLELYSFRPERADIYALDWNPDGTKLAVGLADGGSIIWDLARVRHELADLGFSAD